MKKKKIACITGSRADYGYMRPLMRKVELSDHLELVPIATGVHFVEGKGETISEVRADFDGVVEVPLELPDDTGYGTAIYLADSIRKFAGIFREHRPDYCVVLGDRSEIFGAVQAAAAQNIPIAHMHGGDVSAGGLDEPMRHSITKFAHLHFPATPGSRDRLRRMGEQEERIHLVGSTTIDEIRDVELLGKDELWRKYCLGDSPLILVVQHPVTSQEGESGHQMRQTLESVSEFGGYQKMVLLPNSDQGHLAMVDAIRDYENKGAVRVIESLPRRDYLSFLKHSAVLAGNSSSGIIESSSFGLPVVNIGIRQDRRERDKNVVDTSHDLESITRAITRAMSREFRDSFQNSNPIYGDGRAAEKICRVLIGTTQEGDFLQKRVTY